VHTRDSSVARPAAGHCDIGHYTYMCSSELHFFGKPFDRYEVRSDSWTTISAISHPRDAVGLCGLGDRLYVVGGCDDDQLYISVVESYDTLTDRWTQVSSRHNELWDTIKYSTYDARSSL